MVSNSGEIVNQDVDLIYSYFNGVYLRNGTHDGLPGKIIIMKYIIFRTYILSNLSTVYVEQSKIGERSYQTVTPGMIMYCKSEHAWVFMHPHIRKSEQDNEDCPWLLRSPLTSEYDLLKVNSEWTVWAGGSHIYIFILKFRVLTSLTQNQSNRIFQTRRKLSSCVQSMLGH